MDGNGSRDHFECRVDQGTPDGPPAVRCRRPPAQGLPQPDVLAVDGAVATSTLIPVQHHLPDRPHRTSRSPPVKDRYLFHQGPQLRRSAGRHAARSVRRRQLHRHADQRRRSWSALLHGDGQSTRRQHLDQDRRCHDRPAGPYGDFIGEDHPLALPPLMKRVGSDDMIDRSGNHHDGDLPERDRWDETAFRSASVARIRRAFCEHGTGREQGRLFPGP